jgi:hypothetical protein
VTEVKENSQKEEVGKKRGKRKDRGTPLRGLLAVI